MEGWESSILCCFFAFYSDSMLSLGMTQRRGDLHAFDGGDAEGFEGVGEDSAGEIAEA